MKKLLSTKLVTLAIAVTSIVGCGGSGAPIASTPFPAGIYVSTGGDAHIKFFSNMMGANIGSELFPNAYSRGLGVDAQGQMYQGNENGQLRMVPSFGSSNRIEFGTYGSGINQFKQIEEIKFDSLGRIYVADWGNQRIVRVDDMTGKNWTVLDMTAFTLDGLDGPITLALDSFDRIYTIATDQAHILRFNGMTDTNPAIFGSNGSGVKQFNSPSGIHVAPDGRIYVVDRSNNRIVRFDDMTGTGWTTFGTLGEGTDQFNFPTAITMDSQQRFYVTDRSNYRIVRMDDFEGNGWVTYGDPSTFPDIIRVAIH